VQQGVARLDNGEGQAILRAYRARVFILGKPIHVHRLTAGDAVESLQPGLGKPDPTAPGTPAARATQADARPATALEILDDGSLLVEYADGGREALRAGEVSLRFTQDL